MSMALVQTPVTKRCISRRRFFQTAAAGATGAAIGLARLETVSAQDEVLGHLTLDAFLITYFGATIGSTDSPLWRLKREYASTVRLDLQELPQLALRPKPDPNKKIILAGHEIQQKKSAQLQNGMIMRHEFYGGLSFAFGVDEVFHRREDTWLYGIRKPKLEIVGSAKKPRFRFIGDTTGNGGSLFPVPVGELENGDILGRLSQETIDSWLRIYTVEPEDLVKPRFKLRATTGFVGAGVEVPFDLSGDGDPEFASGNTAVTTAKIIEQTGFTSGDLKEAFAVGNHLTVTHTSLQEVEAEDVVKMRTTISRERAGKTDIYWDTIFKTFLIIDASS